MPKLIIDKDKFGKQNIAYNTWGVALYDYPDENSHKLYIFLKSLNVEFNIDHTVSCGEDWYYVTFNDNKGYVRLNYQLKYVE